MTWEYGEDPQILEIREKLPEPSRWESMRYRVPVSNPDPISVMSRPELVTRIDFTIVRLALPTGGTFYAWQCEKDGKIY
jgi:hypothetical protein